MADTVIDKAVEKTEDKSLSSAITSAIETHQPPEDKKVEDKVDDKVVEDKDKKDDKGLKDYGLTELEQEQARQLFASLKDPEKAPVVLEFFAKQAGFEKRIEEADTKKEVKEVKKDLTALLTEALDSDGAGLGALAKLIAPVIDKYVDDKLKESTADIRQTLVKEEESKLTTAAATKQKTLAQEYFKKDEIPDDILTDMNKMMDRISPSKDMSVEDYIETIFYSVAGRRGLTKSTAITNEKIIKNRNDVPSRLTSGGSFNPTEGKEGVKKMGLTAAIEAAMEAAAKQ